MTRCEDCERLEAKLLRADRKIVELTGECNRLGNMAVQFGSQNGVFQNRARDLRVERDDALAEVERLREVVRQVHALVSTVRATAVLDDIEKLREIHEITKGMVE